MIARYHHRANYDNIRFMSVTKCSVILKYNGESEKSIFSCFF